MTPVFSQISYKSQTMAESSNRFIALDKPIKKYIQEQQKKTTSIIFVKFYRRKKSISLELDLYDMPDMHPRKVVRYKNRYK